MTGHYKKLENMYLSATINNRVYCEVSIRIEEQTAVIQHLAEEKFFHGAQSLHGSVYFKLLDDSAYFAANSIITDFFLYTVSFQIQIVRPVYKGTLKAIGKIVKPGNSVILAESRLYDQRNRLLAIGNGQFLKSNIELSSIATYTT